MRRGSSAVDLDSTITELTNRIVPELDEAVSGVLEIEQEPCVEDPNNKVPFDHIYPKLRDLRFRPSREDPRLDPQTNIWPGRCQDVCHTELP